MSRLLPALVAAALLAGCGSATVSELPGAAEPPRAPRAAVPAAGETFPVGAGPEGIVIHDGVAAVALREPAKLALVDLDARRVTRLVPLPGAPRHLGITDDGTALVPAEPADRFLAVRLPDGRITERAATGTYPHDVAEIAGGVAVGDERGDSVTLVRPDGTTRATPVASQPGGLAPLRGGRLLAVVSVRERAVEILDGTTLERLARAPAGVGPTHIACRETGPCYVLDTQGDAVLVLQVSPDGRAARVTRRVFLPGGPYGVALDEPRARLWVTTPGNNQLAELAAHGRPHVLSRTPTVRQPDSVAVDARTGAAVVTGRTAGLLQIVRP
ncbi:MAG: hypothetical protein JHC95_00630 [Solirubrobacteraceae bacterium]|nr:hypothetical protein [Solirubrobacteraceae bacterium]